MLNFPLNLYNTCPLSLTTSIFGFEFSACKYMTKYLSIAWLVAVERREIHNMNTYTYVHRMYLLLSQLITL